MDEPLIMPVKPGSLNADDKKALSDAGIIVIEHPEPETVRLLRPAAELSGSQMLLAAMRALTLQGYGESSMRAHFTTQIAKMLEPKQEVSNG